MSALAPSIPGAEVLDLFSGSGALGLEALSRGAKHVFAVERSPQALKVLRANIRHLGAEAEVTVVGDDVFRFLDRLDSRADIALADPPYATDDAATLVRRFDQDVFARELWLEHRVRPELHLPERATTRRYGDTALTTLVADL